MKIKGVIFDMDGLMIDTERHYNRCLVRAANELGYPMKKEHALKLRSLDGKYVEGVLKGILGEGYKHLEVMVLYQRYVKEHFENHNVEIKRGLMELLVYLHKNNYILAVATATEMCQACKMLEDIKVKAYFSHICSGSDLENNKPAPDIYLKVAEQMGIKTTECLALEDSPNGVKSAYSAGCRTIMVPDLSKPDQKTKSMLLAAVDSLDCVISILKKERQA